MPDRYKEVATEWILKTKWAVADKLAFYSVTLVQQFELCVHWENWLEEKLTPKNE